MIIHKSSQFSFNAIGEPSSSLLWAFLAEGMLHGSDDDMLLGLDDDTLAVDLVLDDCCSNWWTWLAFPPLDLL